jgi:hypothetical protein
MFHVGQLVVCVDDEGQEHLPGPYVKRGTGYTIRDRHHNGRHPVLGDGWAVWLEEIVSPTDEFGSEWGFMSSRFRPVNDSALDIFRKTEAPTPTERESA